MRRRFISVFHNATKQNEDKLFKEKYSRLVKEMAVNRSLKSQMVRMKQQKAEVRQDLFAQRAAEARKSYIIEYEEQLPR